MSFPRGTGKIRELFLRLAFLQIQSPGMCKKNDSSGGETPGVTSLAGSLTVEAALVLTIVVFSWTALITLFSAMQVHIRLRYAMEQTAEEFAMLAYLTQITENERKTEPPAKSVTGWDTEWNDVFQNGITAVALYGRVLTLVGRDVLDESCIQGGSQGISLLGSSGLTEDGDIDIRLTYRIEIPFLPPPFSGMSMSQRVLRHAWVGADLPVDSGSIHGMSDPVYVTKNGSVYHESASCTHLKLSVHSVAFADVETLRSQDGSRYYPCERCMEGAASGHVYITLEGNRYHSNTDCGSLKRTTEAVEKSETTLPACSKCSAGEN